MRSPSWMPGDIELPRTTEKLNINAYESIEIAQTFAAVRNTSGNRSAIGARGRSGIERTRGGACGGASMRSTSVGTGAFFSTRPGDMRPLVIESMLGAG